MECEDDQLASRRGEKLTWTHVKISSAEEWHTGKPSAEADLLAAEGGGSQTDSSTHGSGRSSGESSPRNVNERNLFRMTDSLANKTFSFAPAGSSPPTSPRGGRRLDRQRAVSESNEMSGDMVYGSGPGPTLHRRIGSFRPVSLSGAAFRESPVPGILRRRLAGQVSHGLSLAEFAVRRDGKLLLAMVGLPARGKTYIAQSIKRHMDWFGLRTEIFNAGNYRRKVSKGTHAPASLFDPLNKEGAKLRQDCAKLALKDAMDSLEHKGVYIAIFDATNTTRKRRAWIREQVDAHEGHVKVVCVETVLTDEQKVWENVKEAKLKSPDYVNMAPDDVMKDFFKRIDAYKSVYEPCNQEEGLAFIRLTNAGEEVLGFKTQGFLCGRIMQLMDSLRLSLRPILLTRCGESEFEAQGRIGGDSRLTPVGHYYAEALARGILQGRKRYGIWPVVWTSTRLRARQTVIGLQTAIGDAKDEEEAKNGGGKGSKTDRRGSHLGSMGELDVLEVAALDEVDAGALEGMFPDDFAKLYPELYEDRKMDKLNVKFPDGESYMDVFARLESLLLEMVAEPQPVVVVAHLAVLRVIYGYLKGVEPALCPHIKIPMHCVLQLNPKGYGYEEWRHYPLMNSETNDQVGDQLDGQPPSPESP